MSYHLFIIKWGPMGAQEIPWELGRATRRDPARPTRENDNDENANDENDNDENENENGNTVTRPEHTRAWMK